MSKFRSSIQHDRLLKKISQGGGTDLKREQRRRVLTKLDEHGVITLQQASDLLGYSRRSGAYLLMTGLVEEGVLGRIEQGTYVRTIELEES